MPWFYQGISLLQNAEECLSKDNNSIQPEMAEGRRLSEKIGSCLFYLKQIKEKRYAESLTGFRTVICYGIAFEGKERLVKQLKDE